MDPKLQALLEGTTRRELEDLLLRDLLLGSLRVEAVPGVDVTTWGPNAGMSRPERDRRRQQMLADLARAERRGDVSADDAAELRRLIKRIVR